MKREFVINRNGKDYVLYAGLLDEAHQQGLKSIKTQLMQVPSAQNGNLAICFAEVTTERGTFTGIGDAEPGNVSRAMVAALIRMAETRAKARALRDAVNVSMLSVEELAENAPLTIDDVEAPPLVSSAPVAPAPVSLEASRAKRLQEVAQKTNGAAPAHGSKTSTEERPMPATQTQLETIAKLARSVGRPAPANDLTRAAASELIARLSEERYGAKRSSSQPQ
jgi:hypothetical protein